MKCENCLLSYSDYSEIVEDGDVYCLVTGDYIYEENCGCHRTNKWILSQDRKEWLSRIEDEENQRYEAFCKTLDEEEK